MVEALTDDTVITEKAPAAASLGKEEENSLDSNINHKIEVPSNSDSGLTDKTSQNPSEASPRAVAEVSASDVSSAEPSDIKPDSTSSIPTTKSGGRCMILFPRFHYIARYLSLIVTLRFVF